MEAIEIIEKDGYTANLYIDELPDNPRKEFDNLSIMVCHHKDYDLGDMNMPELCGYWPQDFSTPEHLQRYVEAKYGGVFEWLGLLDHSCLHMYAGGGPHWADAEGWDSGTIGFAIVPAYAVEKEYGEISSDSLGHARKVMLGEIKEYDQYLKGDVYGYGIEAPDGETVDGCWGIFGFDWALQEAQTALDDVLERTPMQLPLIDGGLA